MKLDFVARAEIEIHAPAEKVWEALTEPRLIKRYFFGADIVTNWREGDPILYRGEWQGRAFEDKGVVLSVEPGRLLSVTHWSPLSGVPDKPENYHTVSYELAARDSATRLTITQTNNASQDEATHSEDNWKAVLAALKQLLES